MSDDLDLRGIDHRHEPDAQFRAALQRRVAAIVTGTDPGSVTAARGLTAIDLESTSAKPGPSRNRRRVAQVILAAAAVVAIALVVTRDANDATPADQPSPTVSVTVTPTLPPRAMPPNSFGLLEPGTYFVDEVEGSPTPRIFVTVDAGWGFVTENGLADGFTILNHDIGEIAFSRPQRVYSDACHPSDGFHPGPVGTVEGLVAALREQQGGWTDVTVPSDISLDGYAGQAFQRTAPTYFPDCETAYGGTRLSAGPVRWPFFAGWEDGPPTYEPGVTETLWVLDIDGTVVLISTGVVPGPSSAARAEVAAAVLTSIRIDRSSSTEAVADESALTTPAILPVGGRDVGVGPLAPDLGQFADQATLIDALVTSGPLDNQLSTDPNLRPGVSICADLVRYHEPSAGALVHVANATMNAQPGVVLVFTGSGGSNEVRMYGTVDLDADTGLCPLLMNAPLK